MVWLHLSPPDAIVLGYDIAIAYWLIRGYFLKKHEWTHFLLIFKELVIANVILNFYFVFNCH